MKRGTNLDVYAAVHGCTCIYICVCEYLCMYIDTYLNERLIDRLLFGLSLCTQADESLNLKQHQPKERRKRKRRESLQGKVIYAQSRDFPSAN